MKKRKKKRKGTRKGSRQSRLAKWSTHGVEGTVAVRLVVDGIEIARGHDGFFRGAPEPVLVCGLFDTLEQETVLIARGIARFAKPLKFPTTVLSPDQNLLEGRRSSAGGNRLAVLMIALEEDSGSDILRAYAMLQAHGELLVLETSGEPVAVDMMELLAHRDHWNTPRKVDLLVDGQSFDQTCRADKWIAAAAFTCQGRRTHRVHFISPNQANDWTAVVRLR